MKKYNIPKKWIRDTIWFIMADLICIWDPFDSGFGVIFKNINIMIWVAIFICSVAGIIIFFKIIDKAEEKTEAWITNDLILEAAVIGLFVSVMNIFVYLVR